MRIVRNETAVTFILNIIHDKGAIKLNYARSVAVVIWTR